MILILFPLLKTITRTRILTMANKMIQKHSNSMFTVITLDYLAISQEMGYAAGHFCIPHHQKTYWKLTFSCDISATPSTKELQKIRMPVIIELKTCILHKTTLLFQIKYQMEYK